MELTEVIRHGMVTEKNTIQQQYNKYTFKVAIRANKTEIRHAIEKLYNVKVVAVNTAIMPGKKKYRNTKSGRQVSPAQPWKKAVVTLAEGSTIEF